MVPTVRSSPAKMPPRARDLYRPILLLVLFLWTPLHTVEGFPYGQWRVLFSLSHSLMHRVANLRASRGDLAGAARARTIAEKLEGGLGLGLRLGFWRGVLSIGWDYMKNYAWRDVTWSEMLGVVSEMDELLRAVNDLTRMESHKDRGAWFLRNYQNVLGVSKSLFRRFLRVFHESGPLRELLLTIQREVEGDLLRDCLEVGTNDFKGLLQVAKDIASQFYSTSERSDL